MTNISSNEPLAPMPSRAPAPAQPAIAPATASGAQGPAAPSDQYTARPDRQTLPTLPSADLSALVGPSGGSGPGARVLVNRQLLPEENHGQRNIFVQVVGPDGRGVNGAKVVFETEDGRPITTGTTYDKDFPFRMEPGGPLTLGQPQPGWIDFPMEKGPRYRVRVEGPDGSELATGLTTAVWSTNDRAQDGRIGADGQPLEYTGTDPATGNYMGHWSHLVVFQLSGGTAGQAVGPTTVSDLRDGKSPVRSAPSAPQPVAAPPAAPVAAPAPAPGAPVTVTVRSGDSLWKLAQAHLGNGARWPELYALNRDAIGPNPRMIVPGTSLTLPLVKGPRPTAQPPVPTRPAAAAPAMGALDLGAYPPANPVGAHGLPNYLKTREDADFVLDLLARTGANNTLLIVPFPNPTELREVDRYFLEKARDRGVTVQLRLGFDLKPGATPVEPAALERYTRQVAQVLGRGPYIALGNEPNLAHEWANGQKPDPEAFAGWWSRYADAVAAGGGHPGLPGLAAGAFDAPDGSARQEFSFYEQTLGAIAARSPKSLDRAWTGAHPYHMYGDAGHPDYVEDVTWQLESFNAINQRVLGRSLPVIATESGYVDGPNARRFNPDDAAQARDVARYKASLGRRPDWLLVGTADWTLSNRHGAEQWKGMFGPQGEPTALARLLEADRGRWEALRDERRS